MPYNMPSANSDAAVYHNSTVRVFFLTLGFAFAISLLAKLSQLVSHGITMVLTLNSQLLTLSSQLSACVQFLADPKIFWLTRKSVLEQSILLFFAIMRSACAQFLADPKIFGLTRIGIGTVNTVVFCYHEECFRVR